MKFARMSVPICTVTITSMATRACAPDWLLRLSLRCFAFYLYLEASQFRPLGACLKFVELKGWLSKQNGTPDCSRGKVFLIQPRRLARRKDARESLLERADTCLMFKNGSPLRVRDDLIRGSSHIFAHLRKFGFCMHVGRGNAASKTEAMYFPPPRMAYEAADTSRFYIDGTGFIDFCEKFKYLGSMLHYSLTSE